MRSIDELDAVRARLLDKVRSLPENVRSGASAPGGGWSPVQVLQHLLLVETLILSDLGRRRSDPAIRRTLRDRAGAFAVWTIFRLGIRVRMPTRRVDPVPALSFDEVEQRWSIVGPDLGARLREAADTAPRNAVMRHPVSGPLSPRDTAAFLLGHMRHHERQLHRILAAHSGRSAAGPRT